jgi:hypothetical protein
MAIAHEYIIFHAVGGIYYVGLTILFVLQIELEKRREIGLWIRQNTKHSISFRMPLDTASAKASMKRQRSRRKTRRAMGGRHGHESSGEWWRNTRYVFHRFGLFACALQLIRAVDPVAIFVYDPILLGFLSYNVSAVLFAAIMLTVMSTIVVAYDICREDVPSFLLPICKGMIIIAMVMCNVVAGARFYTKDRFWVYGAFVMGAIIPETMILAMYDYSVIALIRRNFSRFKFSASSHVTRAVRKLRNVAYVGHIVWLLCVIGQLYTGIDSIGKLDEDPHAEEFDMVHVLMWPIQGILMTLMLWFSWVPLSNWNHTHIMSRRATLAGGPSHTSIGDSPCTTPRTSCETANISKDNEHHTVVCVKATPATNEKVCEPCAGTAASGENHHNNIADRDDEHAVMPFVSGTSPLQQPAFESQSNDSACEKITLRSNPFLNNPHPHLRTPQMLPNSPQASSRMRPGQRLPPVSASGRHRSRAAVHPAPLPSAEDNQVMTLEEIVSMSGEPRNSMLQHMRSIRSSMKQLSLIPESMSDSSLESDEDSDSHGALDAVIEHPISDSENGVPDDHSHSRNGSMHDEDHTLRKYLLNCPSISPNSAASRTRPEHCHDSDGQSQTQDQSETPREAEQQCIDEDSHPFSIQ